MFVLNHYRKREMLGTLRVSNAYEFYLGVREHGQLKEKTWQNMPKAPFEATKYMLYYFAANAQDAAGKDHCDFVLDRNEMWDNTNVPGCSFAYEFVGMPGNAICMRRLPCPCALCCAERYDQCTNPRITGAFRNVVMRVVDVDCPEFLQLPLETNKDYTIKVLKAFLRQYEQRLPARLTKRGEIIQFVMQTLRNYLLEPDVDNNDEVE